MYRTTAKMGHIVLFMRTEADDIGVAANLAFDALESRGYDLSAFDEITTEYIKE